MNGWHKKAVDDKMIFAFDSKHLLLNGTISKNCSDEHNAKQGEHAPEEQVSED